MSLGGGRTTRMVELAGSRIRVEAFWRNLEDGTETDVVSLTYTATPAALIAARIATPHLLKKRWTGPRGGAPHGRGVTRPRVDAEGDCFQIVRRGVTYRVKVRKPIDRALAMPGFGIAALLERFRRPPATTS
jgi:hypothetical protein